MKTLILLLDQMVRDKEHEVHNQSLELMRKSSPTTNREELDVGQRIEDLHMSDEFMLTRAFREPGLTARRYKKESKPFKPYTFPKNVDDFVRWRRAITDERVARRFGAGLFTVGPQASVDIEDLVEDEILPQIMLRFIKFDDYEGTIKGYLGMFAQPEGAEDSEIVLVDHEERLIYVVSHSFKSFFARGLECIRLEEDQDYFYPSEPVERIIRSIDGEDVLPTIETGRSVFFLDNDDEWPESWLL